ncbi:ABC transporter ATP-binding protein [Flexivirga endophytica]|uniref:ABC transporter ATP-binding protein n=1 Tax=Flexivirga endophytica TaxID=1849103 RepID=A0A916WQB2_9MICO|nr:ATP-binding cassette domain-containing protein [Flexivirga endophytica]GGB22557.1 ABC transporter ATP-binding protein [Flexivirga endophytica]GHB56494.1 ABC transporter ATP-binding protein [Flexivirga endophytica]
MDDKTDPPAAEDVLRVEGITKAFGPIKVLRGVDLHLAPGEVLGVVGSNGAGKSTLVKIITGYQPPDQGQLYVEGEPVDLHSVQDARSHGIETVFQDLALVDELSVYHNLFLNREVTSGGRFRFLNNRRMRADAMRYLEEIQVDIPSVDLPVEKLSGGQRQAIAVARATRREDVKILLLDEPLAAMGAKEAKLIIDLVKSLARNRGVSMLVIDHNYTHIFELCDRVNVVEQGRITLDKRTADTSLAELTEFMVSSYRQQVEGASA